MVKLIATVLAIWSIVLSCQTIFVINSKWENDICSKKPESCEFQPTWESLDNRTIPKWYDEFKFGIFIHWGVFSVPALGEWFWYNWKGHNSTNANAYMKENYKPNFTYQEFAKDFTGEFFDPEEWASLFRNSGAKYVVLTSKHHEGYTLWPSKYSFSWNSVDVGPHLDIVGDLASAVRKKGMKFGLYHSLYEWFNPLYLYDKENNFTTQHFVLHKTLPELFELVEKYEPEVIWSDGEWEASDDYWKSKEFIAWLYNSSPVKDTVVINDRWGSNTLCKHGGYLTCADRYNPGKLQERKWENAMTIDKGSWGYRRNINVYDYYTVKEILIILIETVSYGGNLLLNVGPTQHGIITPVYQERLLGVGKWLERNGDAIFNSKPWMVCQNDTKTRGLWYTTGGQEATNTLYATFVFWPNSNIIILGCVQLLESARIEMFGTKEYLTWKNTTNGTEVILPSPTSDIFYYDAWVLRIIGAK